MGPEVPAHHRHHLVAFSTTPPPVLTIPQEVLGRLLKVISESGDVTQQVEALKTEYKAYYDARVSSETRKMLEDEAKPEPENKKVAFNEKELTEVTDLIFSKNEAPPPWEELQKQYRSEIVEMEKRPGGCSGCQRSAIRLKYRHRVVQAMAEASLRR